MRESKAPYILKCVYDMGGIVRSGLDLLSNSVIGEVEKGVLLEAFEKKMSVEGIERYRCFGPENGLLELNAWVSAYAYSEYPPRVLFDSPVFELIREMPTSAGFSDISIITAIQDQNGIESDLRDDMTQIEVQTYLRQVSARLCQV